MIRCKYAVRVPFREIIFGDDKILSWMDDIRKMAAGELVCGTADVGFGFRGTTTTMDGEWPRDTGYNYFECRYKCFVCGSEQLYNDTTYKEHPSTTKIREEFLNDFSNCECERCQTKYAISRELEGKYNLWIRTED